MKFEKCIIHIGTEKTGSTSIQRFLEKNRELLLEKGHFYPASLGPRWGSHYYTVVYSRHEDVYDDLRLITGVTNKDELAIFRKELERNLELEVSNIAYAKCLHISCENLQSRLHGLEAIKKFKSLLLPYCDNFQVLCYLRPQHEVALSLYSTDMKLGGLTKRPLPEVNEDSHYYNYMLMLGKWEKVFGFESINVRLFHRDYLYKQDLIKDYLEFSGIDDEGLLDIEKENESLSPECLIFLRELNKYLPRFEDGRPTNYRKNIADIMEKLFPGKGMVDQRSNVEDFYNLYRESNNLAAKRYLGCSTLFEPDFSRYPEGPVEVAVDFKDMIFDILSKIFPLKNDPLIIEGVEIELPVRDWEDYQKLVFFLGLKTDESLVEFFSKIWRSREFKLVRLDGY